MDGIITKSDTKNIENVITEVSEEDVKLILQMYGVEDHTVENFGAHNASDKMLGFLADYWRLKVNVVSYTGERRILSFFIKAVSCNNEAKAAMVKELGLFGNECRFYADIKNKIEIPGLKPFCPKFISSLDDAMVFEDLDMLNYKMRNKFQRFDMLHTLQALRTLARFHAASIHYEQSRKPRLIDEDFKLYLNGCGYRATDSWFLQCMNGALQAVQTFSKHSQTDNLLRIEKQWRDVWVRALEFSESSQKYHNVISHRDLWNNNIFFHYKEDAAGHLVPDDCLLIDFQALRCQPPAGDVMLLLHCNLDPKFREKNLELFLNHYYQELKENLEIKNVSLDDIIPLDVFLKSAEEYRLWGLIACACLIPQFWIEDEKTTKIFSDNDQFHDILSRDKGRFIKRMMMENIDYTEKVMEVFDEIIERHGVLKRRPILNRGCGRLNKDWIVRIIDKYLHANQVCTQMHKCKNKSCTMKMGP